MIMRRLARSIRKQDWFSVAIEFIIVVVGIFVGLQVTESNEQRQARERELDYLMRLGEDAGAMRAEIYEILALEGERPESALGTFRALEQCDAALAAPHNYFRGTVSFRGTVYLAYDLFLFPIRELSILSPENVPRNRSRPK